jgi:hypothetical protein
MDAIQELLGKGEIGEQAAEDRADVSSPSHLPRDLQEPLPRRWRSSSTKGTRAPKLAELSVRDGAPAPGRGELDPQALLAAPME